MSQLYTTTNKTDSLPERRASATHSLVENSGFPVSIRKVIDLYAVARTAELFTFLSDKNCVIVNEEEIKNFLNSHTSIIDYLYQAPAVIKGKFGDVKLNLELSFDPEFNDDEGELFLNIETNLGAREANDKLNEIDKEWFLLVARKDIGVFNLNLDFI